jgi:hypothetical protein
MNFSVTDCSLKFRLGRPVGLYFFGHVNVEIQSSVEYQSCSE